MPAVLVEELNTDKGQQSNDVSSNVIKIEPLKDSTGAGEVLKSSEKESAPRESAKVKNSGPR